MADAVKPLTAEELDEANSYVRSYLPKSAITARGHLDRLLAMARSSLGIVPEGLELMTPDEAWQNLLDKDDRTSEHADMCLITYDELKDYMLSASPAALLVEGFSSEPNDPTVCAAASEQLVSAAREAHQFAVMYLAFTGRDRGTKRLDASLDGLDKLAIKVDDRLRAALPSSGSAS